MFRKPLISFIILFVVISGCIDTYYPDEDNLPVGTMVVVAHLNNIPGEQTIYISRSSALIYPEYDPEPGCFVEVISGTGESVEFIESKQGEYKADIAKDFLRTGKQYLLHFVTSSGEEYESEYELLNPSASIDSVYYELERRGTADPAVIEEGIRFYLDFEIEKDSARYLRWELIETYEFHNPDYPGSIYDVDYQLKRLPDSSSWRTCWITSGIQDIFVRDLGNFSGQIYKELPLNFVSNMPQRLHHKYSLLVRQLSLSPEAFRYWDELANNVQTQGGLFDKQPSVSYSNICHVTKEDEPVIGYFSISGATEIRIIIDEVPDLELIYRPWFCFPGEFPRYIAWTPLSELPIYIALAWRDGERYYGWIRKECLDCREYRNSTHIEPDYW